MPPGTYSVTAYLDVERREGATARAWPCWSTPRPCSTAPREVVLDARDARLLKTDRAAAHRGPAAQGGHRASTDDDGHGVPQRLRRPAGVRRHLRLADRADDQGSFMLTTRWRKGEPMLSLGTPGGQATFDTLVQPGSALDTRHRQRGDRVRRQRRGGRLPGPRRHGQDRRRPPQRRRSRPRSAPRRRPRPERLALIVVNDGVGGLMEYVGESPSRSPPCTATPGRAWSRWPRPAPSWSRSGSSTPASSTT